MLWLIIAVLGLLLILAQALGLGSFSLIASFGWLGVFLLGLVWLLRSGPGWWQGK